MCGLVLPPLAMLAAALGAWRLGADPGWTSDFFIKTGPFSRYQLWFAIAIAAQLSAYAIKTFGPDSENGCCVQHTCPPRLI
jgi:hypothetical protein